MNGTVLAGAVFALIGLIVVWLGIRAIQRGRARQLWAITTGMVLHTELADHPGEEGEVTYTATVSYEYEVGRIPYQGTRYNAEGTPHLSSLGQAQRISESHPPGSTVTVFFAPDNPGEALLVMGIPRGAWMWICFGLLFLGVGIYIILTSRAVFLLIQRGVHSIFWLSLAPLTGYRGSKFGKRCSPQGGPNAVGLGLERLVQWHQMGRGNIRNIPVSASYLAAANGYRSYGT